MKNDIYELATTRIVDTAKESLTDIKHSLLQYKPYATGAGLLLALTSLFLGIEDENPFLRRIQSLLLFLSTIPIGILLVRAALVLIRKKHSELYRSFALLFIFLSAAFLFNILGYLLISFEVELLVLAQWLGVPIIALVSNVLLIFCFRLIRKYYSIKGRGLEDFFLVVLNVHLAMQYVIAHMDIWLTFKRLGTLEFGNILILYLFFFSVLMEIRLVKKDMRTVWDRISEVLLILLLIAIPYILYYGRYLFR